MLGKIYFFRDDKYVQLDPVTKKADPGYPRSIAEDWIGLPSQFHSDLDDVEYFNGNLYLFKGGEYLEYDLENDHAVDKPLPLGNMFKGIPADFLSGFDSTLVTSNQALFITKNSKQISTFTTSHYNDFRGDESSNAQIYWNWPPEFQGSVDAALSFHSGESFDPTNDTHFFKSAHTLAPGGDQQPIDARWHGLDPDFASGIDAAVHVPTEKARHGCGSSPSPALQTGRRCAFNLPPDITFYVAAMNTEKWERTVHVTVDGKLAKPVGLPASDDGLVQAYESGTGSSGWSSVSIGIDDCQSGLMLLGWYPPVMVAGGKFLNIGAENDDKKEAGFDDVAVCVFWRSKVSRQA